MIYENDLIRFPGLALFAEGAPAGGTETGGQTGVKSGEAAGSGAGTRTGDTSSDASSGMGAGECRDAAGSDTQDAAAPAQASSADRDAEFDRMIRGEYKEAFDRRVQPIVQKRIASLKDSAAKYERLLPYLERLTAEAETRTEVPREEAALPDPAAAERTRDGRERIVSRWLAEAEELKGKIPSFDLKSEMKKAGFRTLIVNGIPLETAFFAVNRDALLPAALHAAAKDAEARTAAALSAGQGRPREGATAGGTAQVIKSDVTRFTKADRDEIVRRTAAGERIVF